jgi:hypothetical protein
MTVAVPGADADVPEPAQVAQGDGAVGVDAIAANPVVSRCWGAGGRGFDLDAEDGQGVLRPRARWGRRWL